MLEQLGLDQKEEGVYRALLRLADASAAKIAKESGLKRTSVYHILENLMSMGLVSTYIQHSTKRYAAENPTKLKSFFEQKMILAERLTTILQKEIEKSPGRVNIRFFEGQTGLRSISEEALEAKEKKILTIGSSRLLLRFLGGKYGFGERRRKRGIIMKSLRMIGDEPSINPRFHQVKYLPRGFDFPGYIQIFDDKVGIIIFDGKGFGFVITSEAFTKMAKSIFEILWQTASAQE